MASFDSKQEKSENEDKKDFYFHKEKVDIKTEKYYLFKIRDVETEYKIIGLYYLPKLYYVYNKEDDIQHNDIQHNITVSSFIKELNESKINGYKNILHELYPTKLEQEEKLEEGENDYYILYSKESFNYNTSKTKKEVLWSVYNSIKAIFDYKFKIIFNHAEINENKDREIRYNKILKINTQNGETEKGKTEKGKISSYDAISKLCDIIEVITPFNKLVKEMKSKNTDKFLDKRYTVLNLILKKNPLKLNTTDLVTINEKSITEINGNIEDNYLIEYKTENGRVTFADIYSCSKECDFLNKKKIFRKNNISSLAEFVKKELYNISVGGNNKTKKILNNKSNRNTRKIQNHVIYI
jgi:hypothetical protein